MKAKMLENQVAIITGGAQGLGKAMVQKFAEEGAKVAIADMNIELAEKLAVELKAEGLEATAYKVNVADSDDVNAMVDSIIEKYGRVHVLINNAGIIRDALFKKMDFEAWDSVIKVNLYGTYNCTKAVVNHMIEHKYGRIINLASLARMGNVGQTNYSATKAGVTALARTWGKELGRYNITANAIAPGGINTELFQQVPDQYKQKAIENIPLGRVGEPEDIANTALFLASEMGQYVNAQVIHVDGGTMPF